MSSVDFCLSFVNYHIPRALFLSSTQWSNKSRLKSCLPRQSAFELLFCLPCGTLTLTDKDFFFDFSCLIGLVTWLGCVPPPDLVTSAVGKGEKRMDGWMMDRRTALNSTPGEAQGFCPQNKFLQAVLYVTKRKGSMWSEKRNRFDKDAEMKRLMEKHEVPETTSPWSWRNQTFFPRCTHYKKMYG